MAFKAVYILVSRKLAGLDLSGKALLLFTSVLATLGLPALSSRAAGAGLDGVLAKVEQRYNRAKSLRLNFDEAFTAPRRARMVESGTLSLRKPGRMRWDYSTPPGKVFLSDGKYVYLYLPELKQIEKSKLKETEDMRAPLAFLLGKLDFQKEFRSFSARAEGPDTWLVGEPKNPNLSFTHVEFMVAPDASIRRLKVVGQDQSTLDFVFSNETVNPALSDALFHFPTPAGVQLVESNQ